jgi:hypothetical protein
MPCGWRDDAREVSGRRGSAGGCGAPLCSSLPCLSRRERSSVSVSFRCVVRLPVFTCFRTRLSHRKRSARSIVYPCTLSTLYPLMCFFSPSLPSLSSHPPLCADSAEQHSSLCVRVTAACVRSIRCMQHDGACLTTLLLHPPPLPSLPFPPASAALYFSCIGCSQTCVGATW